METLTALFEGINKLFGVEGPGDLIFHPAFIAICAAIFIYSFFKGWKFMSLAILGMMGGALVFQQFYPEQSSDLMGLMKFLGAAAVLTMIIVYLGFIRE